MFDWFKKKTPPTGPDFSAVDSREKALAMVARGELEKMYLMPLEFGGEDIPPNVLFVPIGVAAAKAHLDVNVIGPLAEEGKITEYRAEPEYEGKSFIPIAVKITASNPGSFTADINIWGAALGRK